MLVSIIITTYGRTDFLKDAIGSAIGQTYPNIEIIVVDDNAEKEEIREEVKKIVGNYPSIKLICNKKNLGGSLSRNEGIKAANGELISFLDDDDYYALDRIEKYINFYEENRYKKIGLIYSYVAEVDSSGNKIGEYRIKPEDRPLYQHMLGCIAATSQWMIPRKVFDEVGMFEDTPCKQDSIMLLKILGAGFLPICKEEILGFYRKHDQVRISGVSEKNIQGLQNFWDFCRKYYTQLSVKEKKNVEATFASQMLILNVLLKRNDNAKENLNIIFKNRPISKVFIKSFLKFTMKNIYTKLITTK